MVDMIVEGLAKLGNRATNPVMEKLRELVGKPRNELIKERLIIVLGNLNLMKIPIPVDFWSALRTESLLSDAVQTPDGPLAPRA